MDLDLLAESESDSDSSHSNIDGTSIQRSAITQATAGSDAGNYHSYHSHPSICIGNHLVELFCCDCFILVDASVLA